MSKVKVEVGNNLKGIVNLVRSRKSITEPPREERGIPLRVKILVQVHQRVVKVTVRKCLKTVEKKVQSNGRVVTKLIEKVRLARA